VKDDADTLFAKLAEEEAAAHPEPPLDIAPEDWVTFLLFWGLACVVFLQFFTRYILNDSLTWTEEIAQYLLMVITFAGSAMAARRGTHITVEFLLNKLPSGTRRIAHALVAAVATAFFAASAFLCWQVSEAMRFQPMIAVEYPLSIVYYGILFGLALTAVRTALHGVRRWREGEPEAAPDPSEAGVKL
jgi:TRAP-type C4-dicarboxylate transport system permease small subunit